MPDRMLTMENLIVFSLENEPNYARIGILGSGARAYEIFYQNDKRTSTVYDLRKVNIIEYGHNNGEYCALYLAISKAYPKYVNKNVTDFVDYTLSRRLKPNELFAIEKEYNKIYRGKATSSTDTYIESLFNKAKKH